MSRMTRTRLSHFIDERRNFLVFDRTRLACGAPQIAHEFAELLACHKTLFRFDDDDGARPLYVYVVAHLLEPFGRNKKSVLRALCTAHVRVTPLPSIHPGSITEKSIAQAVGGFGDQVIRD